MLTLDELKSLKHGDTLYHTAARNADGTPVRARVTGKVKTWKTRPECACVPMKHGLRDSFYIDELGIDHWCLEETAAIVESKDGK